MGLLSRGAAFLNGRLPTAAGPADAAHAPLSLTYSRTSPAVLSATVVGWPGIEDRDESVSPNPTTRSTDRERDYMIAVSALSAFGVPAEGDRITEVINAVATVFEVSKRDREPCYRYADHARSRYRIHTRKA